MYRNCLKRVFDFILSLSALIVLSPILLIFTVIGAFKMKGNPFFTQLRPGKDEKIFKLIKFRSMTEETAPQSAPEPQNAPTQNVEPSKAE